MLRYVLGALGLALGFDFGRGCVLLSYSSAVVAVPVLLVAWPILCFGGLTAGVNIGSLLDKLLAGQDRQPLRAAGNRPWLVRCLGAAQSGISLVIIIVLGAVIPPTLTGRLPAGLVFVRPALLLVGVGVAWLLLLKGWFELLTGARFREWPSFWRSLSLAGKLAWVVGLYGSGILLATLPALLLLRLVTV